MSQPAYPLVFLHLPKTAGTTLDSVLRRQIPRARSHLLRSDNFDANLAAFKAMPEEQRHRIRLLRGHQPFGLHGYLAPGARYLTVLREPVARIISHYHYVKSTNHPMFADTIRERSMSLVDYVRSGISGELENGQTRWLAGIWDDRPLTEADYGLAISNIEQHFDWVGLTETFDESLVELAWKYRWLRVYYRRRMVASSRPARTPPAEAVSAIIERNPFDLRLYAWVKRRFDAAGAAHRLARSGAAQLLDFANRLGGQLRPQAES